MNDEIFQELLAKQARVDELEAENAWLKAEMDDQNDVARMKAEIDDHNKWFVALESYRELEAKNAELHEKLKRVEVAMQMLVNQIDGYYFMDDDYAANRQLRLIAEMAEKVLAVIREGESKKPVPGIDFNPNVPSLDGAFD